MVNKKAPMMETLEKSIITHVTWRGNVEKLSSGERVKDMLTTFTAANKQFSIFYVEYIRYERLIDR